MITEADNVAQTCRLLYSKGAVMRKPVLTTLIAVSVASVAIAQTAGTEPQPPMSALELLDKRVPEVSFEETPFEQVVEWLREHTGVNVTVHWQVMQDAGLERDTPISLKARNIRLSQVLWMIVNQAAGSELEMAYRVSDDLITLSLREDFEREMIAKVYDVSDLLLRIPRFRNAARLNAAEALNNTGSGDGQSRTAALFRADEAEPSETGDGRTSLDRDIRELIRVIQRAIEPTSWQGQGGGGTVTGLRRQLIVRNTPHVHQLLGGYLREDRIIAAK